MNTEAEDIALIERYLAGKLTPAEVFNFEYRLADDREFARKFRLIKNFPELMKEAGAVATEPSVAAVPLPEKAKDAVPLPEKAKNAVHLPEKAKDAVPFKAVYLLWGALIVISVSIIIFFIIIKTNRSWGDEDAKGTLPVNEPSAMSKEQTTDTISGEQTAGTLSMEQKPGIKKKEPIELKTPGDGMAFNRIGDILFRWEMETDTFTNLFIYEEAGDQLVWWRGIKPGIREHKVPAIYFPPGRFYWYVGTKEVKRTFIIQE